jgi:hypothetical protein
LIYRNFKIPIDQAGVRVQVSIKLLRDSLDKMAIADETAAGIPDD